MIKREIIAQELSKLSAPDLDRLLVFLHTLSEDRAEACLPALAAESLLAED